MIRVQDKEVKQ